MWLVGAWGPWMAQGLLLGGARWPASDAIPWIAGTVVGGAAAFVLGQTLPPGPSAPWIAFGLLWIAPLGLSLLNPGLVGLLPWNDPTQSRAGSGAMLVFALGAALVTWAWNAPAGRRESRVDRDRAPKGPQGRAR
jgi:hypothetical protein